MSLEKGISVSPWSGVRESVCVKSLKETELNRLPKIHIATWERTRKEKKGKCTENEAVFSREWIWGKSHPSPQGCYSSGVSSSVLQSHKLKCNQHNLLEQHILGSSSTSVFIQRGWVPSGPPQPASWAATSSSHYPVPFLKTRAGKCLCLKEEGLFLNRTNPIICFRVNLRGSYWQIKYFLHISELWLNRLLINSCRWGPGCYYGGREVMFYFLQQD